VRVPEDSRKSEQACDLDPLTSVLSPFPKEEVDPLDVGTYKRERASYGLHFAIPEGALQFVPCVRPICRYSLSHCLS
jgi:hypothetical protein